MTLCLPICRDDIPGRSRPAFCNNIAAATLLILLMFAGQGHAQSTFGAFTGTVKDPAGNVIPGARVVLTNTGTSSIRKTQTNAKGEYSFQNVDAGSYAILINADGFKNGQFPGLILQARETQRVDAMLTVGDVAQTVVVTGGATVIDTDTSNLGETRTGTELDQLPLAISSRASGSTSPFATLTSQAGVQTDSSGNLSVAGAKPSMLSLTVDGISTMNVESSSPSPELFPSFASIEEIQVNQNSNNAEYGGVSDITTVSKSGTNRPHGGAYDNYETAGLNAKNPFAKNKPKIVMNDFGAFYGGPIIVPKLYDGKDKTFFFASYEGLRLPQQSVVTQSVPTNAMRSGDLSAYKTQIYDVDGTPFANNQIPESKISPVAKAALTQLFPAPNYGSADAISNNYQQNFVTPILSDQGDLRIDQNIGSRQSVFARYSNKQRSVSAAPTASAGSALIGAFNKPEKDTSFTTAYSATLTPTMVNEVRFGFSKFVSSTSLNYNSGASDFGALGITGIPDLISSSVPASPNFSITGFTATGGTGSAIRRSRIIEALDNLTWIRGAHTLKTGGTYSYLNAFANNVFGSIRLGKYFFTGTSEVGKTIGQPFAAFLLGYPDKTETADVLDADMNGFGHTFAFYAQDSWKVSPSLDLNYGLRWEYHPTMGDHYYNSSDFDPTYSSFQSGQLVQGAIIVPNEEALTKLTLPSFASAMAPLPILTAAQDGLPVTLVKAGLTDFAPRVGFAWRPFHNDKTVLRGGWGRYIQTALGGNVVGGWAVSSSAVYISQNQYTNSNKPLLSFPSPFQFANAASGTLSFDYGVTTKYKDPTTQQWNLTIEQDLGFNTGLRLSYLGSHSSDLTTFADLNQLPYNTVGYDAGYASRPFPEMSTIDDVMNLDESNYNAFTVEAHHRMSHGLQFQGSYTFAKDLSDSGGGDPTGFESERGTNPSDRFHPGQDYGNVEYTSRNRALVSFLYHLPFGRGQKLLAADGRLVDGVIGGWQLASFMLFQSGPFMTPLADSSMDPTGSGINQTIGYARADVVPGVSPYLHGQGSTHELNPAAFAQPPMNVGRQGTAAVGSVVGPGTSTVSASLFKALSFSERYGFQFGVQAQNIFNHPNLDVPASLVLGTSNFGEIDSVQTQGNAGPRSLMLTGRLSF
jgi:Carboxypeptidase regulatory-like domain